MPRPATLDEYLEWAQSELNVDFKAEKYRLMYETNVIAGRSAIQESQFYISLPEQLRLWEAEYRERTGSSLLLPISPELLLKPFKSAVEKSFRRNILWNRRYPKSPEVTG